VVATRLTALHMALFALVVLRVNAGCEQSHQGAAPSASSSKGGTSFQSASSSDAASSDGAIFSDAAPSQSAATGSNAIFSDDFTGATLSTNWVALSRHGDYDNNELECYLPANVFLTGAGLAVTSLAATQTCGDSTHSPSTSAYTSGMLQWSRFHFTYGTVEFKAKMPGGQGTWPAVWLLGSDCQASNVLTADNVGTCDWPNPGSEEIDITEIINSDHVHVNQALIGGAVNTNCTAATSDVTQNFHVYRLVWTARSLVWTIDGAETCTLSSGVPSTPMFVIIDTALGGVAGSVSSATLPQTMNVAYITVTQP